MPRLPPSVALRRLPARQRIVRLRYHRVHDFLMDTGAGGQFDDIAIRIAEINRADKAVINRPAHLAALALRLVEHVVENIGLDPEGDVQVERVLLLEVEGHARHLEEGEAGAVIHLEEGVQPAALIDLERADQATTEEILIENPRLLRVPAAIRVMMQTFDHASLRSPMPDGRIPPIADKCTCRSRCARRRVERPYRRQRTVVALDLN